MSNATYKIRRLKWRREVGGWFADTSIYCYFVEPFAGRWRFGWFRADDESPWFEARTLREAKAACQEHFERKLRVFLVRVKQ